MEKRHYEIIFIMRYSAERAGDLDGKYKALIEQEGEITRFENWGPRDLAYHIDGFSRGVYVLINTNCLPSLIGELEKKFKFDRNILRYMIFRCKQPITDASPIASRKRRTGSAPAASSEQRVGRTDKPAAEAGGSTADQAGKADQAEKPAATDAKTDGKGDAGDAAKDATKAEADSKDNAKADTKVEAKPEVAEESKAAAADAPSKEAKEATAESKEPAKAKAADSKAAKPKAAADAKDAAEDTENTEDKKNKKETK